MHARRVGRASDLRAYGKPQDPPRGTREWPALMRSLDKVGSQLPAVAHPRSEIHHWLAARTTPHCAPRLARRSSRIDLHCTCMRSTCGFIFTKHRVLPCEFSPASYRSPAKWQSRTPRWRSSRSCTASAPSSSPPSPHSQEGLGARRHPPVHRPGRRSPPASSPGLRRDDILLSTHRGHGHTLAKGAPSQAMMNELIGREGGSCSGKGGSMHIADFEVGMLGANGVVGANIVIAAGAPRTPSSSRPKTRSCAASSATARSTAGRSWKG